MVWSMGDNFRKQLVGEEFVILHHFSRVEVVLIIFCMCHRNKDNQHLSITNKSTKCYANSVFSVCVCVSIRMRVYYSIIIIVVAFSAVFFFIPVSSCTGHTPTRIRCDFFVYNGRAVSVLIRLLATFFSSPCVARQKRFKFHENACWSTWSKSNEILDCLQSNQILTQKKMAML